MGRKTTVWIFQETQEKTQKWPREGNLKIEAETLQIAVQNNAKRINHIKAEIDNTQA